MGSLRAALKAAGGDWQKQTEAAYAWFAHEKRAVPQIIDHGVLTIVDQDTGEVTGRMAYLTATLVVPAGKDHPVRTEYGKQMALSEDTWKDPNLRTMHKALTVITLLRDLIAKGILQ